MQQVPVSGIYAASATVVDGCGYDERPLEFLARVQYDEGGDLRLPVITSSLALASYDLRPSSPDRFTSLWENSFPCGARRRQSFVGTVEDEVTLRLTLVDQWQSITDCDEPFIPDSDCTFSQVIDYTLVETCELPCQPKAVNSRIGIGFEDYEWECVCE